MDKKALPPLLANLSQQGLSMAFEPHPLGLAESRFTELKKWRRVTCIAGGADEEIRRDGRQSECGAEAAAERESTHAFNARPRQDGRHQPRARLPI